MQQIALWMYRDSGGEAMLAQLTHALQQADIKVYSDFDMRRCYCNNGRVYTEDGIDLSAIPVLYLMNADEQTEYQRYILHALERSGVRLVNRFQAFDMASDKFAANQRLRQHGLPVPDSMLVPHTLPQSLIRQIFAKWGQAVVKPRYSFGGKGIMRFAEAEQFIDFLGATKSFASDYYLEQFIPFDDHDYRIEVIDGQAVGAYSRGLGHSFKTNMSACADKAQARFLGLAPKDEHSAIALAATQALGLDCTIVDMIEARADGKTYIIEINCQLGIFVEQANQVLGIHAYGDAPYRHASDQIKMDALSQFLIRTVREVSR